MHTDSRPWGLIALTLFVAGSLAYRSLVRDSPWTLPPTSAEAPPLAPQQPTEPGFRALLDGDPLDVNTASAEALEQLPGIGPSLSARIRQQRASRPFRDLSDMRRVRGLGAKSLAKLEPFLRFEPSPAADPADHSGGWGKSSGAPETASSAASVSQ